MKFAVVVVFCMTWQPHVSSMMPFYCITPPCLNTGGVMTAPINLDTSQAVELKTDTPLLFTVLDTEKYKITNTGNTVEVTLNQPSTMCTLTGGVLGNAVYKFYKIRFFWDQNYDGDASYKVDSAESALNGEYVYYNQAYGSLANGYNKPNAVVVIRGQLTVEGNIANPRFTIFETILRNLTKAGSYYCLNGSVRETLYAWADQKALRYPFYYSYKAIYFDQEQNSTVGYDATYLAIPKSISTFLSVCQFTAFTNLKTYGGRPIAVVEAAYPSAGRIVHQSTGWIEKICYTPYNCTTST